jgi:hypothetical protein
VTHSEALTEGIAARNFWGDADSRKTFATWTFLTSDDAFMIGGREMGETSVKKGIFL